MNALDTNVVVRLIVGDNAEQTAAARALIERGKAFVATTVILETEWVLRSVYHLHRNVIAASLERLCGLEQIELERPDLLREALRCHAGGMDFADALHLLSAEASAAQRFCTFDADLAKSASRRHGGIKIERL